MEIASNTIVKNGMPFIVPVLERVLPFMNRSLVTVSKKSNDGTMEALYKLGKKYPDKLVLFNEDVPSPGFLTVELGKLLGRTTEDWVLFLDADDWWPTDVLREMMRLLETKTDAYVFNPYQIVDRETYDSAWWDKWFTKLFKNDRGVHYEGYYPKENLYKVDEILWWKDNLKVKKSYLKYYHLANIIPWKFREHEFGGLYKIPVRMREKFAEELKPEVEDIFSYL